MDDDERSKDAGSERRKYFRVDDILPVVVKIVDGDRSRVKAKICSGFSPGVACRMTREEAHDEHIPLRLWEMLVEIQNKLGLILEKLFQQSEGLTHAECKPVSLSAAGIGLLTRQTFALGDFVEVQMLLAMHAPVWIVVYGEVTRFAEMETDENEVAINFADMDEDIRDMINYYTLKRQRELIRKQRGYGD
jgi:c-di-GMP-binding flagellar brake protein YcgR